MSPHVGRLGFTSETQFAYLNEEGENIMKMSITLAMLLAFGAVPFVANAQVVDQERPTTRPQIRDRDTQAQRAETRVDSDKLVPAGLVRASEMMNKAVYNSNEEQVGTIYDVVLDQKSGKIAYVALSTGGFLGLGDKMFAVPYDAFSTRIQDEERVCVLNVSQESLESAQGFNQDNWPNQADSTWMKNNNRPATRSSTSLER